MYAADAVDTLGGLDDLLLDLGRERLLGQLAEALAQQLHGNLDDEEADDDGGGGVENTPAGAEDDGAADTYRGAYGREGVAAVVPRIGNDGLRAHLAACGDGEAVAGLLGGDRDDGHPECECRGGFEFGAVQRLVYLRAAAVCYACTHDEKRHAYDKRGDGLILAVSVVV